MKKFIYFLFFSFLSQAQVSNTSSNKVLVNDPQLQFEITEAMIDMYNFRFSKADSAFRVFKQRYPKHPLPYFLLGYSQYWRIMPNEDITTYDDRFIAYMDSVIEIADEIYDKDEKNFEAIFFLTAAHAFKGRLYSDRKEWTKATFAGKNALKYLKLSREYNDLSPEFLFGEGLFNYYSEWIPENFKAFKPIMWFFPKGDKQTGIKILKEASNTAFYTRTEAQHYLIKILLFEEKKDMEALPTCRYLINTYPLNPVFQRLYARLLFSLGYYGECESVSMEMLKRLNDQYPGYEEVTGRYAAFFIGWVNKDRDKIKSKEYFLKSVEYAEKVGATKMNYYFYALDELAKFAKQNNNTEEAKIYYKKIKDNAGRKHELYKSSKKYLKQND